MRVAVDLEPNPETLDARQVNSPQMGGQSIKAPYTHTHSYPGRL